MDTSGHPPSAISERPRMVTQRYGNALVVNLTGELDVTVCPQVRADLIQALHARPGSLIVDLTSVTFLGSAVLRVLLETHRAATGVARFRIATAHEAVLGPIALAGLDQLLAVYATREEALTAD